MAAAEHDLRGQDRSRAARAVEHEAAFDKRREHVGECVEVDRLTRRVARGDGVEDGTEACASAASSTASSRSR